MYVETDFVLALLKDEDWLGANATQVFETFSSELWTSAYTLIELLLVAYREDMHAERVVANTAAMIEVKGNVSDVIAASTYVAEDGLTPFDALHLVASKGVIIVSSDPVYDDFVERLDLRSFEE